MKSVTKEDIGDVYDLLLPILKDDKIEDEIVFEKLNTLCDLFQFYPMIVKKDRNRSTSIYYIMNANKTPDHKVNLEILKN